ncbi:single-strand DNA-binding protein [Williamsoniiplasma somnilux]|uniref:Single-stranded DNA-binding protein n=1 Tax=Williamsoniiplasma somnilux TaxID=215578 RepID=A0A2K8NZB8_9MOLU|nr:single-stranded DNA-binding protein [Williamsoniiplasma somnilux]ATZ19084.1 single-strand DNA-binding protein [Williamsoniiplasma somnilux]
MNQVSLIGRITRDLELRDSSNGSKFVGFTLAVSEYRNGNEFTNFIPCVAWEKNAENMVKFVKKGAQVGVTGRISVRSNNVNGKYETIVNVNADRVEFLDSKTSGSNQTESFTRDNSNYDMDQINAFEPQHKEMPQPASKQEEEIIISDDSILWD